MSWTVRPYDLPLAVPYRWAHGTQTRRRGWLVTDGAHWGEIADAPHLDPPRADDVMAGADPASAPAARIRCGYATARCTPDDRSLAAAIAEPRGLPVSPAVSVNALLTSEDPVPEAEAAWADGFRTFKIKVAAGDPIERVAAVRDAFPRAAIRLDPNGCWDDPVAMLDAYAPFDIEYVEDAGIDAHPDVPLAVDAGATDLAAIQAAAHAGASRIIIKPQRLGGPDLAAEAIAWCRDEGVDVTVTNSLETTIGVHAALHVAALVPGTAHGLATSRFLAQDAGPAPAIADGQMQTPALGLGVSPWSSW